MKALAGSPFMARSRAPGIRASVLGVALACAVGVSGCEEAQQIVAESPGRSVRATRKPPLVEDAPATVPESPPPPPDDVDFFADLRKIPEVRAVLADPEKYRVEVLFTEVGKPKGDSGKPELLRHGFRVDREYFYPASAIKLAAAVSGLEALRDRGRALGHSYPLDTPMRIFDSQAGGYEEKDSTDFVTGRMNLAHELKKMLVISDNEAFNRIYAFVGHREMNTRAWKLGLTSVRIRHRLGNVRDGDDSTTTPEVDLVPLDGAPSLIAPERTSKLMLWPVRDPGIKVGRAHIEGASRVDTPMDFSDKNRIGLMDLQRLLTKIVLPEADEGGLLPLYDESDRTALMSLISMLPSQSRLTGYDTSLDEVQKLSSSGVARVLPAQRTRLYGKSGRAYGFSIENTYVYDPDSKRAFFLTAALYTNDSGIVGSDHYEYAEIANPFFIALGEYCARRVFQRTAMPEGIPRSRSG
jgi:hypothetical protein